MPDYIESFLNKHRLLKFLYKPIVGSLEFIFNLDSYPYRIRHNLSLALGTKGKPRLYIACVGHDHQHESELLMRWMQKKSLTKDNCRVLVFSSGILPFLIKQFPVLYYRDIISQAEEIEYFALAYKLIKELSSYIAAQQPEFAPLLASIHHSRARELFSLIVLQREIERISEKEGERTVAVVDIPWRTNNITFPSLPYAWQYDVLDNSRSLRHHKFLQSVASIFHLWDRLFQDEQKLAGKLSPYNDEEDTSLPFSPEAALVLTEDSGSFINLASGKAFVLEMIRQNLNPVVLTRLNLVARELEDTGCRVYIIPDWLRTREYRYSVQAYATLQRIFDSFIGEHKSLLWDLFSAVMKPTLHSYLIKTLCIKGAIDRLCSRYSFSSAVAFGESNFLPAGAFPYLAARDISTIGIEAVVVMDHPMCEYWPAREHLAYGDQMLELLVKQGIPHNSIHVVGSEQYDRCQRRNKADDIKYTHDLFPQSTGKKIVVIATENRPRQMIEIEPSVRTLAKHPAISTIIKLHPDETAESYLRLVQELGKPDNVVVVGKEVNTLALVHTADLLVTMGSNLIIEAGVMGTPSLVYNFADAPCPIDFVKEDLCFGAYSVEEFEKLSIGLVEDDNLRKEAYNKLKLISRFTGPNDGQAIKRMVDIVTNKQELDIEFHYDSPLETRIKELKA